jgi:hypothetical protein
MGYHVYFGACRIGDIGHQGTIGFAVDDGRQNATVFFSGQRLHFFQHHFVSRNVVVSFKDCFLA